MATAQDLYNFWATGGSSDMSASIAKANELGLSPDQVAEAISIARGGEAVSMPDLMAAVSSTGLSFSGPQAPTPVASSAPAWASLPGINDPVDGAFAGDFVSLLRGMLPAGATNEQIANGIQQSQWYGNLGSGSNPYNAAVEAANRIGANISPNPDQAASWNQYAVDRSPEGIARANDDDGLFGLGGLGELAALAAAVYTGGAALGAWGGAGAAGAGAAGAVGAAGATTASSMLAAESAAMLQAGFSAAEVASSLAGLGNVGEIAGILTAAGVGSSAASTLATQALQSSGLLDGMSGANMGSALQGAAANGAASQAVRSLIPGISNSTLGQLGGAALGGLAGSQSGSKEAGTTTTTQSPWAPMQPYLLDIAGKAQSNYNNSATMSPQTQGLLTQAQGMAQGQMSNPAVTNAANSIFNGTAGFTPAPMVGTQSAFGSMGDLNPTNAYKSLLSGNVTNPYLSNIAQDNFTLANRNLMENVMPAIGSGASAAGQYGGSRQGIAQGLAASRMNQDVTMANNQMFGNAYQQAQNNMAGAANTLGGFGMNAASTNATNTLNNNSQRLGQMTAATDMLNTGNNMQNTAIKNSLDLSNYGNTYANNALGQYAGIASQLGGMGGQSTQPYYTNPGAGLLGGALAGSQIFKNIF